MQGKQTADGLEVRGVVDFDLAQTLDCGQSFRWKEEPDGSFSGVAKDRALRLRLQGDTLFLDGITAGEFQDFWFDYFDFGFDYGALKREYAALSPILAEAAGYAPGMRLLRQDPWEALCSFILSQNNNIPRIKGIVERLCAHFGDPLPDGGHAFPTPGQMASLSVEALAPLRAGFRAKYLMDAARRVAAGETDLVRIAALPMDEARAELQQIQGIGPKVAECVLLYGMHRLEAFPMDVWMKRAMGVLFPGKTPSFFGPCAGVAQQYLFHYSRRHPELFAESNAS